MAQEAPAGFSAAEIQVLSELDDSLRRGKQLLSWFLARIAPGGEGFREIELAKTFRRTDRFNAFFDTAPVDGTAMPVMAADQTAFFDRIKDVDMPPAAGASPVDSAARAAYAGEIREFALRHFLSLSEQRLPQQQPGPSADLPPPLNLLSWYPSGREHKEGFAFHKKFYKSASTGKVLPFTEEEKAEPIDLTLVGAEYEWIVITTVLLNTQMVLAPLGPGGWQVRIPMPEMSYLVIDKSFVFDQRSPEPGVTGRHGCGYAMIRFRKNAWPFVYGPGQFDAGIQLNLFDVLENGSCRARQTFLVNQPRQLMSILGFDPVMAYIAGANLFTMGLAGKLLGITRESLCKLILFEHSTMIYNNLLATLRSFRHGNFLKAGAVRDGAVPVPD